MILLSNIILAIMCISLVAAGVLILGSLAAYLIEWLERGYQFVIEQIVEGHSWIILVVGVLLAMFGFFLYLIWRCVCIN